MRACTSACACVHACNTRAVGSPVVQHRRTAALLLLTAAQLDGSNFGKQEGEQEIREAIDYQRKHGRITTEVVTFTDGKQQVRETHTPGVDPSLLRTLSTHTDRRNRQAQNQMAPDQAVNAVQINVVKDFLGQADSAGKLSADAWNEQNAIDVSSSAS